MAKKGKEEEAPAATGQGAAKILPNGVRRIDFIRDSYYTNGKHTDKDMTRGAIRTAINDMLKEAGRESEIIAYQIVFAACKKDDDPRVAAKEEEKTPVKGKK